MIKAEITIETEVQFYDVDAMGIVWHGNYVKFLEMARSALLDSIGYNYREMKDSGLAWPIVDVRLRYLQSTTYGQRIKILAKIVEYELRLRINYLITDAASGKRLTKGHTVQIPVDIETGELLFRTPEILCEKLGVSS